MIARDLSNLRRSSWLVLFAFAITVVPTLILQLPMLLTSGRSNPFSGVLAFAYIPMSFLVWQISLVFLVRGRHALSKQSISYLAVVHGALLATLGTAIALFFLFPAKFG